MIFCCLSENLETKCSYRNTPWMLSLSATLLFIGVKEAHDSQFTEHFFPSNELHSYGHCGFQYVNVPSSQKYKP